MRILFVRAVFSLTMFKLEKRQSRISSCKGLFPRPAAVWRNYARCACNAFATFVEDERTSSSFATVCDRGLGVYESWGVVGVWWLKVTVPLRWYEVCFLFDRSDEFVGDHKFVETCSCTFYFLNKVVKINMQENVQFSMIKHNFNSCKSHANMVSHGKCQGNVAHSSVVIFSVLITFSSHKQGVMIMLWDHKLPSNDNDHVKNKYSKWHQSTFFRSPVNSSDRSNKKHTSYTCEFNDRWWFMANENQNQWRSRGAHVHRGFDCTLSAWTIWWVSIVTQAVISKFALVSRRCEPKELAKIRSLVRWKVVTRIVCVVVEMFCPDSFSTFSGATWLRSKLLSWVGAACVLHERSAGLCQEPAPLELTSTAEDINHWRSFKFCKEQIYHTTTGFAWNHRRKCPWNEARWKEQWNRRSRMDNTLKRVS